MARTRNSKSNNAATATRPADAIDEARRLWTEHGWAGSSAKMATCTAIMRTQQVLLGVLEQELRRFDLTPARFDVLTLLEFSRQGRLPLGKIGARLMVHPTSITSLVDRLERQGLVTREPHPTDRRATLATITPAGRQLVRKAQKAVASIDFGLTAISEEECEPLYEALARIRSHAMPENGESTADDL
jgi:DNA-binding MarR family transcriptional regulator